MAKMEIGSVLNKAQDVAKQAAHNVAQAADSVAEAAGSVSKNVAQAADSVAQAAGEAAEAAIKVARGPEKKDNSHAETPQGQEITAVTTLNALQVFYYFMAVDGEIPEAEMATFDEIGQKLDEKFEEHSTWIIGECSKRVREARNSSDYYSAIRNSIEQALRTFQNPQEDCISTALLIWDLLVIAGSDSKFENAENQVLEFVVETTCYPRDRFLELKQSFLTIQDMEKEMEWLKAADRPYRTIEPHVKELEKRRNDILDSVHALIIL